MQRIEIRGFKVLVWVFLGWAHIRAVHAQPRATNPTDTRAQNVIGAGSLDALKSPPAVAPNTDNRAAIGGSNVGPQKIKSSKADLPLPTSVQSVRDALAQSLAPEVLPPALKPVPNGLNARQVSHMAVKHSFALKASRALQAAAEAESTEVYRRLWPRLQFVAQYTKLSPWRNPGFPVFNTASCLGNLAACQANPSQFETVFPIPTFTDQYNLRATLTVPLSDLVLKLREFYRAAKLSEQARALDTVVAEQNAALAGQESFFEYLRAVGQHAVADQGVQGLTARQKDVEQFVVVGDATKVDLLKIDAQLSELHQLKQFAENALSLAEVQLRQRIGTPKNQRLANGEPLDSWVETKRSVDALVKSAWTNRPELRLLDKQVQSLDALVRGTRASLLPSLTAAANADVSNPNTRFFPQTDTFRSTWDATLQLAWSPNDAWTTDATIGKLRAQQAQLRAQRQQTQEALELEVRGLWNQVSQSQAQLRATLANLRAAEESQRVKRAARSVGTATETELLDAQTELLRARMNVLNAQIDIRIACARLNRAVGEL